MKITIHGPHGETENLEVIHELGTQRDTIVNLTAMMRVQQCLLAAMAVGQP
jgi:transaldolase